MNLSAVVPAALSAAIYHESVTVIKAVVLALVVVSIVLLWKDKQKEGSEASSTGDAPARTNVKIWITAMLAAFFLNGVCPFGLRVLAGWGLAERYTPVYLVYWYFAGFAFGLLGLVKVRHPLSRANFMIGLIMAVASVGGQFSMGLALSHDVPGSVVYMLAMGASMCVVVLGGVLIFHERVGVQAKCGIAIGLLAAVLLGIS
jgi:multidrug transporter EmrE-like cation transporter